MIRMIRMIRAFLVCLPAAVVVAASILFIGCEGPEGPAGPAGSSLIHVSGEIAQDWYNYPISAQIYVYESPSIPAVSLNGIDCIRSAFAWGAGFNFQLSDSTFAVGNSFHLEVSYLNSSGQAALAYADVVLPGSFVILTPDTNDAQVLLGSDLLVAWTPSSGADCYVIDFEFHYSYHDTLGMYHSFWLELDTLMTDTTITFDAQRIFPDAEIIGDLFPSSYNGWFNLWAQSGPWQEGDPGNVRGDGYGNVNGRTLGGHLTLYLLDNLKRAEAL